MKIHPKSIKSNVRDNTLTGCTPAWRQQSRGRVERQGGTRRKSACTSGPPSSLCWREPSNPGPSHCRQGRCSGRWWSPGLQHDEYNGKWTWKMKEKEKRKRKREMKKEKRKEKNLLQGRLIHQDGVDLLLSGNHDSIRGWKTGHKDGFLSLRTWKKRRRKRKKNNERKEKPLIPTEVEPCDTAFKAYSICTSFPDGLKVVSEKL